MISLRSILVSTVCVLAVLSVDALAAPIVSQPFFDVGTQTSDQISDPFGDELGADNFMPASTVSMGTSLELNWWGSYLDMGGSTVIGPPPPFSRHFTVRFYSDSPGTPDALLGGLFNVGATRDAGATSGLIYGYSLDAPFTLGFDLVAGTTYWISIAETAVETIGIGFVWREGTEDTGVSKSDSAFDFPIGSGWASNNTTDFLAFELSTMDAQVDPVPEPSSLALLGMGACGFIGYSWRRRKRGTDTAA